MICEHKHAYNDLLSASVSDSVVMKSAVILWAVQQVNSYSSMHPKKEFEPMTTWRGAARKP